MRPKLFIRFDDIEKEVSEKTPPVVYKYRDWSDPYHQAILKEGNVWFAHPFDLNDEEDIRPDIIFDETELYEPGYFAKMVATAGMATAEENHAKASEQLALLKSNPSILTENAKNWNSERSNFDQIGVFSNATVPLSEHLWNEYSNKHSGFSIGFNTLELCRQMHCGFGFMHYSDDPILYRFLDNSDNDADIFYYKKTKWKPEEEFRFITVGVGKYVERVQVCTIDAIAEVTIGHKISKEYEVDIISVLKEKFEGKIPLYKTFLNPEGKLDRSQINY